MKIRAVQLLVLASVLLLTGCIGRPVMNPEFTHTGSLAETRKLTAAWVAADPVNRTWSTAGYTGSMRPLLYGGEHLLLVRYTGQPVLAGQIVVFDRGDVHSVIHRVVCSNKSGLFTFGDACSRPDGWFPLTSVKFICAGIITHPQ